MGAHQGHGILFEEYLADMMPSFIRSSGATDEKDGTMQTRSGTCAISVKNTSKRGEICMGSFKRIANSYEHTIMFDGRHEPYEWKPDQIIVYDLPRGFQQLFLQDQIKAIQKLVKDFEEYMFSDENLDLEQLREDLDDRSITFNDYEFDPYWREKRLAFNRAYKELFRDADEGNVNEFWIHPRPKRDHDKQRRLQCAIPKRYHNKLFNSCAALDIYINDDTVYVYDYTDCFNNTDESKRVLYDEHTKDFDNKGQHDCYIFDRSEDNDFDADFEARAWEWVEHIICVGL